MRVLPGLVAAALSLGWVSAPQADADLRSVHISIAREGAGPFALSDRRDVGQAPATRCQ
jgi:hypothetical protein